MSYDARTVWMETRDGPAWAEVPDNIVAALERAAGDPAALERGLTVAAAVILRSGPEAGAHALNHWLDHDPNLVLGADDLFIRTLADEPELIVGPLAGTPACTLNE